MIRALISFITGSYVAVPTLVLGGLAIGAIVFFSVYPGKPQIGVIDIPYTVINDDTAFEIGAYLDYARRTDSVKGVMIRLNSPGGGAAASEQLFLETASLREVKPVVIAMNDIVASGGYMMALGANHTFVKGSSLVGSVGVILSFPGPQLPSPPTESVVVTGPLKQSGGTRRDWIVATDVLKEGFAQMVVTQRGDKLKISREELMQAGIFSGIQAVQMGLVDEIGGDTVAIEKVAELAGVSSYELVDVNVEVARIFVEKSRRIFASLEDVSAESSLADSLTRMSVSGRNGRLSRSPQQDALPPGGEAADLETLRRAFLSGSLGQDPNEALPDFPRKINGPNIYYLYAGPAE